MPVPQVTQIAIASTGVAQQLPSVAFLNQYLSPFFRAKVGNTASIVLGNSSAVTATTGFILEAGAQIPIAVSNANQLYMIGTSGDVLSIAGA